MPIHPKSLLVSLLITAASSASAQDQGEVALRSADGAVEITGALIAIEDGNYVIDTAMGVVRVSTDRVACTGLACATVPGATALGAEPAPAIVAAEPVVAPVVAAAEPAPEPPASTVPAANVPADRKFGIHGSRTIGTNLIPNLLQAYAAKIGATYQMFDDNPKERFVRLVAADGSILAEIDLQTKGSGSAFPALADGLADIGMADRRMNDKDLEKLTPAGIADLRDTQDEIILGLDGIVTVVHPSNPLQNITLEELSRIFSGEATNWRDFGGPDAPIVVHSFPDGSGDRSVFLSRAVDPFGKTETEAAIEHTEYAEMQGAVLADPNAIGFLGRPFVGDQLKFLPIREQCGLISSPTNFRMKTEGYAMSRRVYLYRKPGKINPVAQALIDFAFTPEGQDVIVASNFTDRELESMTLADMQVDLDHAKTEPDFNARVFATLSRELADAERQSIAFRFEFGKTRLDPLSERAVSEFAAVLNSGAFDGKEIIVAGFADSVGTFDQNDRIASGRARNVEALIRAQLDRATLDKVELTPVSYGELLPYLCNEDDFGRDANRRVEVWVR